MWSVERGLHVCDGRGEGLDVGREDGGVLVEKLVLAGGSEADAGEEAGVELLDHGVVGLDLGGESDVVRVEEVAGGGDRVEEGGYVFLCVWNGGEKGGKGDIVWERVWGGRGLVDGCFERG